MNSKAKLFIEKLIDDVYFNSVKDMVKEKNRMYGNSAFEPLQVYSKLDARTRKLVSIDNKISRLKNQQIDDTEDTIADLIGYYLLVACYSKCEKNRFLKTKDIVASGFKEITQGDVLNESADFLKEAESWGNEN